MSIIKCPECGHNVSTMAGTCPGCGIAIDGHLRRCPQCGSYCLDNQPKCTTCGQVFKVNRPSIQATNSDHNQETSAQISKTETTQIQPEQEKTEVKKKTSGWVVVMWWILGILITAALFTCAYFYYETQQQLKREEYAYNRLQNVTNPDFYQQFINDYPNSPHIEQVKTRMVQLQTENEEWEKTLKSGSRLNLVNFMKEHPDSYHARECNERIDSIDWAEVLKEESDEALDLYLANHPAGIHAEEASQRKNDLIKTRISAEDKGLIQGVFEGFFNNALVHQDATSLASYITDSMSNFCGQANATPEQILSFTSSKKANDVIGIHYVVASDMNLRRETLPDGSMGYAADFTLEETINRSDANKANQKTYQVTSLLSQEKKIIQMKIK